MSSALILFSGGQDSTVCLVWCLSRYDRVETVGFDYGQRHRVELQCREGIRQGLAEISPDWSDRLGVDHVLDLSVLGQISDTALTREKAVELREDGLPNSFVPARNLVFLSLAASLAFSRGIERLAGGMGQVDYSGYPDCRAEALQAMQLALSEGLGRSMPIETPLMHLDKAQIWGLSSELGGERLTELIVERTHSCYLGDRVSRHGWGYGCGRCPACRLRLSGWEGWCSGRL